MPNRIKAKSPDHSLVEAFRERGIQAAILLARGMPVSSMGERPAFNALIIFLFRIITVLFAGSRGLLGRRGPGAQVFTTLTGSVGAVTCAADSSGFTLCKTLEILFRHASAGEGQAKNRWFFPARGCLFDKRSFTLLKGLRFSDAVLQEVMKALLFHDSKGLRVRIDYSALPPKALGGLYESLLPYFPGLFRTTLLSRSNDRSGLFRLKDPTRAERRRSGAFYTGRSLADALVASALAPAFKAALEREWLPVRKSGQGSGMRLDPALLDGKELRSAEKALLDIKVVDPACGSASFLLAAQDFLAGQLLRLRCGSDPGTPAQIKSARKAVLMHCLFGVDKDPMALELARISLWLNTGVSDLKPGILDSNLKWGDALVGAPLTGRADGKVLETKRACDQWTAAFFLADKKPDGASCVARGASRRVHCASHVARGASAPDLARTHRFFHWRLEFPAVFARPQQGFDCVLANPPWERIKVQEREFFSADAPEIARAGSAALRQRLIEDLRKSDPSLYRAYRDQLEKRAKMSRFLRRSGRYNLVAGSDPNTYLYFVALCRRLLARHGLAGMIVPSGLATDQGAARLFNDLMEQQVLVSLDDFFNQDRLFQEIAGPNRFCLLTVSGVEVHTRHTAFRFACSSLDDLKQKNRQFILTRSDLKLLNPNTGNCPPFASRFAARTVKSIYRTMPILVKKRDGAEALNPWGVRFWNMFHMSSHSGLFRTAEQLKAEGYRAEKGLCFTRNGDRRLRLYESKLMHQFNHRYNTFKGIRAEQRVGVKPGTLAVKPEEAIEPGLFVEPRYWVPETEVARFSARREWNRKWFLALRSITNTSTNRRSVVPAFLPWSGVGNSATLVQTPLPPQKIAVLAACFASFAFDFVARSKLGGPNLNFFILEQLPVPPPERFDGEYRGGTMTDFIASRVLELSYTAWDLAPFARDMGHEGSPFDWDEDRRATICAELDALFFMVYGVGRGIIEKVLSTFPILERKERVRFGEYRTLRLIHEAWDRLNV